MAGKNKNNRFFAKSLALGLELGIIIAVPLVGLAVLGKVLDDKLNTFPWMLLLGSLLGIVISLLIVIRKTKEVIKEIRE